MRVLIVAGLVALGIAGAILALDGGDPTAVRSPSPSPMPSPSPSPTDPPPPRAACGTPDAPRTVTFRVSVERGLDTTRNTFARAVHAILCDERSWIAAGEVRFRYRARGDTLVSLRSAEGTERRCQEMIALSVNRTYSCASSAAQEAVINADRWFGGADAFPGPRRMYRRMLINHEVGHVLTQLHVDCPADGAPAPVMMQQSKGMNLNGRTCRPNPWPLPDELERLRASF